ncbi:MAG TPA: ABC transporter ATP-binding protein [Azospirillum sp.]|nr:ABC transporter ATP-binding protein [Azospirillum sp.]
MKTLLSIRNLRAGYGESVVLEDISIDVEEGEVVCLLGSNGAGKTTTMGVITGLIPAMGGRVTYQDADLLRLRSHQRVNAGIALSPEGRKVFPNLTVHENLLLGSYSPVARPHRAAKLEEVYSMFPRLAERRAQKAGLMSGGEQQMLAIGRALMACPKLLLLDEPSLGLAPRIVMQVFDAIARIARTNISILLVEQNTHAALSVATRGYVISGGRIMLADDAAALRDSVLVQRAFIGQSGGSDAVPAGSRRHA